MNYQTPKAIRDAVLAFHQATDDKHSAEKLALDRARIMFDSALHKLIGPEFYKAIGATQEKAIVKRTSGEVGAEGQIGYVLHCDVPGVRPFQISMTGQWPEQMRTEPPLMGTARLLSASVYNFDLVFQDAHDRVLVMGRIFARLSIVDMKG